MGWWNEQGDKWERDFWGDRWKARYKTSQCSGGGWRYYGLLILGND